MANRVEELETRVDALESTVEELQAAVTGLSRELVHANERVRELEAAVEPDAHDPSGASGGDDASERVADGGDTSAFDWQGSAEAAEDAVIMEDDGPGRGGRGEEPTGETPDDAAEDAATGGEGSTGTGEGAAGTGDGQAEGPKAAEADTGDDESDDSEVGDDIIVA